MKTILLAIALFSALPITVNAEENISAPIKATEQVHQMQNADPAATQATETAQPAAHVMQNDNPSSQQAPKPAQKHTMRNN